MAILKDLIVRGASRFIDATYYNAAKGNTIAADKGIFNELIATSATIDNLDVQDLTAQEATVVGLLDVKGELHSKSWTNSNISTINNSFYIVPTLMNSSQNNNEYRMAISYSNNSWMISIGGHFIINSLLPGDTNGSGSWTNGSKIAITGEILIGNTYYPLGTLVGNISNINFSTSSDVTYISSMNIINIKDRTGLNPTALEFIGSSNNSYFYRDVQISLLERNASDGSSSGLRPIGIYMTAQDGNTGKTFLDVYGGGNVEYSQEDTQHGGLAIPKVRIGNLTDLPAIEIREGGVNLPVDGYGIYTDNGYFIGTIYSQRGLIGGFDIGENSIYNTISHDTFAGFDPSYGILEEQGIYIGTDGILHYKSPDSFFFLKNGKLFIQGATIYGDLNIQQTKTTIGQDGNITEKIVNIPINSSFYQDLVGLTSGNQIIVESSISSEELEGSSYNLENYIASIDQDILIERFSKVKSTDIRDEESAEEIKPILETYYEYTDELINIEGQSGEIFNLTDEGVTVIFFYEIINEQTTGSWYFKIIKENYLEAESIDLNITPPYLEFIENNTSKEDMLRIEGEDIESKISIGNLNNLMQFGITTVIEDYDINENPIYFSNFKNGDKIIFNFKFKDTLNDIFETTEKNIENLNNNILTVDSQNQELKVLVNNHEGTLYGQVLENGEYEKGLITTINDVTDKTDYITIDSNSFKITSEANDNKNINSYVEITSGGLSLVNNYGKLIGEDEILYQTSKIEMTSDVISITSSENETSAWFKSDSMFSRNIYNYAWFPRSFNNEIIENEEKLVLDGNLCWIARDNGHLSLKIYSGEYDGSINYGKNNTNS